MEIRETKTIETAIFTFRGFKCDLNDIEYVNGFNSEQMAHHLTRILNEETYCYNPEVEIGFKSGNHIIFNFKNTPEDIYCCIRLHDYVLDNMYRGDRSCQGFDFIVSEDSKVQHYEQLKTVNDFIGRDYYKIPDKF